MKGSLRRYLLVGIANTGVGYSVILVLQLGLGAPALAANAAGYAAGWALSYMLNRDFTFKSRRAHRAALPGYVAAAAICYLLNAAVLHLGLDRLGLPVALAQALAIASYTVSFYLLNRYVVFAA